MSKKSFLIVVFMLSVASSLFCEKNAFAQSDKPNTPGRYVDSPDLMSVIKRVLTPEGMLDPAFALAVAKPSRYLSDFYGVQAIQDVSKKTIRHDFVPKYALVVKEDEHSIELKFKEGWTGRFVVDSSLEIKGTVSPVSHVYISGDTWQGMLKSRDAFLAILKSQKLDDRYLIKNSQYQVEIAVEKKLSAVGPPVVLSYDPGLQDAQKSGNIVVVYPDRVHGDEAGFNDFLEFLKGQRFDWLGLEAMTADMQKDLDTYINSDEKSPEFAEAEKKIANTLANGWDKRFANTKESHFMKIMRLMRTNKTRVIGMEGVSLDYIIWRYGETLFGAAVRSYVWAQQVPPQGRGAVFGGSAHFTGEKPLNFQDFLRDRNKDVKLYTPVKFGPFGK